MRSDLELAMEHYLRVLYLSNDNWPEAHVEYRFIVDRRFRFDFAFLDIKLAVECEGGLFIRQVRCNNCGNLVMRKLKSGKMVKVFAGGRHNTGSGAIKDMEKYNLAVQMGWLVLRYNKAMIDSGEAINQIERIVHERISGS